MNIFRIMEKVMITKDILKNLLLLSSSFLFVIIFLEVVTRLFFPQNLVYYNNDIWRPDDLYGYRHYENAKTKVNTSGAGLVNFVSDENGFRINVDNNLNDENYQYEILALGDSFLEALQVENKNTFIEQVKDKLKIYSNIKTIE